MTETLAPPATKQALAPYFPKGTKVVGTDVDPSVLMVVLGTSGSGKSHLGRQLLHHPDYGKDEVLYVGNEDFLSILGPGAHVRPVSRYETALAVGNDLLDAHQRGERLPKVIVTDSASGLALGTQAYYRAHPIEVFNEKTQEMVRNKYAEFGELGTGFIDYMLVMARLPGIKIVLCTTHQDYQARPEIAVEGKMIPKFIKQMSTCTLYLSQVEKSIPIATVEAARAAGTLEQSHRIICPHKEGEATVKVIDRYLYSQGGGEVTAKGHHALAVEEKADLPAVLAKILGKR